jgi:hypothetical protein
VLEEPKHKKVLIGCVGRDDPVSPKGDRPIITAAWYLQPDRVDLIYSPSTEDAYRKTKQYLWLYQKIQDCCSWCLHIQDPTKLTRYEVVVDELVGILQRIKESVSKQLAASEIEFHIVESGMPAMRTVLVLAAVSKVVSPVTVWHVDDPPPEQTSSSTIDPQEKRKQAAQRMSKMDLSRFEGAALRFFTNIRLHLQVTYLENEVKRIDCEVVPGHWLKFAPDKGPMRFLLELCKARRGDKYGVRHNGGWICPRRLDDGNSPSIRSQARLSINKAVASIDLGDRSIKELIQVRGSTKNREYRVSLEPEEILIEYVGSSV